MLPKTVSKLTLMGVEQDSALLNTSTLELQRLLGGRSRSQSPGNLLGEGETTLPNDREKIVKKTKYGKVQKMFQNNQSRLVKNILDGKGGLAAISLPLEVASAFKRWWEVTAEYLGLGQFTSRGDADNGEFRSPISAAEVCENLGSIKNGTAAGPDGITKTAIKEWDPSGAKLAATFSIWLTSGTRPGPFKKCRTTLIPKSLGGDLYRWY